MRCASTFLQQIASDHSMLDARIKSRVFSYNPYFEKSKRIYRDSNSKQIFDSDENYSLGRFKRALISHKDLDFNLKKELSLIYHNQIEMRDRIKRIYPQAKVLMIIRRQSSWIKSVYKHDIEHFAIDTSFKRFLETEIGKAYTLAADYFNLYKLYVTAYGAGNVKVVLFESLKNDEENAIKELEEFLGFKLEIRNRNTNESKSNSFLIALRFINFFSQRNPSKKEYRIYNLLRSLLIKNKYVIDFFLKKNLLVFDDQLKKFQSNYLESNEKLGKETGMYHLMNKFGYF